MGYQLVARPLLERLDAVRGEVELTVLRPPTFDSLREAVRRAADEGSPFHIVHFDGHGPPGTTACPARRHERRRSRRRAGGRCLAGWPTGPLVERAPGGGAPVAVTIADSNLSDRDGDDSGSVNGLFSDNVFVFESGPRRVAVIAEVQTDRPDADRCLSWPAYVANARRRHRCDTFLMVFAIKKDAARGSAKAIRMGHPGWDLVPLISGIGKTPRTPPPDGRFVAELVLLRVITRDLTLGSHDARMFALAAIQSAPRERIARYTG